MDGELNRAREHHNVYTLLVSDEKIMADVDYTHAKAFAPISAVLTTRITLPDYVLLSQRLYRRNRTAHRVTDAVVAFVFTGSVFVLGTTLYSAISARSVNVLDSSLMVTLSLFFIIILAWGAIQRRYSDIVRYKLFVDETFFKTAMETPGAIRLFWIMRDADTIPKSYTIKDFSLIASLIQDESADIVVENTSKLRSALGSDREGLRLLAEGSLLGHVFASADKTGSERKEYDVLSPESDDIFLQNFMDLLCANEVFFKYAHMHHHALFSVHVRGSDSHTPLQFINNEE